MTDPWLVQNSDQEVNNEQPPIKLQNGHQEIASVEEGGVNKEVEQDKRNKNTQNLQFEDNFAPTTNSRNNTKIVINCKNQDVVVVEKNCCDNNKNNPHQPLADSAAYLQGLQIKLEKLRKGSKLVEALSAKREDCMRTLLDDNNSEIVVKHDELNEPVTNGDSAVHEIYRHLQPIQAVTVGELVHILQHDQLEDNEEQVEEQLENTQ